MSIRDSSYDKLAWNKTSPCATCPYRITETPHEGICANLHDLWTEVFGMGQIGHTCHQTDPESDYEPAKNYTGPIEACVGFTLLCEKENALTIPIERAIREGKLDLSKLKGRDSVYASVLKLLKRYLEYFKGKVDA